MIAFCLSSSGMIKPLPRNMKQTVALNAWLLTTTECTPYMHTHAMLLLALHAHGPASGAA